MGAAAPLSGLDNALSGTVEFVSYLGASIDIHVRLSPADRLVVQIANREGGFAPEAGQQVHIGWRASASQIFSATLHKLNPVRLAYIRDRAASHFNRDPSRLNSLSGKLSVYPNPAQSSVTISFSCANSGPVSLRLFDMKGSLLWQQQYNASAGQNNVQIACIRNIPTGTYILQWFDGLKPEQVKIMVTH